MNPNYSKLFGKVWSRQPLMHNIQILHKTNLTGRFLDENLIRMIFEWLPFSTSSTIFLWKCHFVKIYRKESPGSWALICLRGKLYQRFCAWGMGGGGGRLKGRSDGCFCRIWRWRSKVVNRIGRRSDRQQKNGRCERLWREWCHLAIIQGHASDLKC